MFVLKVDLTPSQVHLNCLRTQIIWWIEIQLPRVVYYCDCMFCLQISVETHKVINKNCWSCIICNIASAACKNISITECYLRNVSLTLWRIFMLMICEIECTVHSYFNNDVTCPIYMVMAKNLNWNVYMMLRRHEI